MRAFLFIACCLLLSSCFDKGDCLFLNTPQLKVAFMDAAAPTTAKEVVVDSLFIPDLGYFVAHDTIQGIVLLVDSQKTETEYVFQYGTESDTLVLGYTNLTRVLSPDCGSYLYQDNLEIIRSTFGDGRVIIKNQRLLTNVTVNVEILF